MDERDLDHSACGTGCDMEAHARELGVELDPRTWKPSKPHLYLAGAINGKSDEEANGWRREAAAQLGDLFDVLDPMARDYRGIEAQNVAAIVEGDLTDIGNCSVILVRAEAPSWGTAMELVYARGRCVIGFGAGERPSPWLVHHTTQLVPDLAAAIAACRELVPAR